MGPQARAEPGGIDRIQAALGAFEREIEADLAFRGIDLRDLWRPGGGTSRMTYRRLGVLIDALPGDSAYKTAVRDNIPDEELIAMARKPRDKHGTWSHEALLLAALVDRIELLRRDTVAVNGGTVATEFTPVPRPGVPREAARKRRALSDEGRAYLMKIRHDHERANGYGIGVEAG